MCGIAGIVASDSEVQVDIAQVQRMCAVITHRGPDDEGIYVRGPAGLGMRRLSIIDVSGGQQPIHNEDHSAWIVFNGEIYNFRDLRRDLEAQGHRFYTHSDTEVIVHLYEDYGADCVSKLRGMFAFAVYDLRKRKLLLARDRLGKKPLHYAFQAGVLYFGSEIKSMLAVAPNLAEVDNVSLGQFFFYGYIPDPRTSFTRIRKLPPGHYLEFADNQISIRQYWDMPQFGSNPMPEEECLQRIEGILADAVRMRLISEVPLGVLLSGGVDSSVVVATMARTSDAPVKTFTIGFGKADFDEAEYARTVANQFGTEHHELTVDPDLWSTLELLSGVLDEPFADSSILPTYHVSRMARKYVTVVLSGDGGDELFAGYDRYAVQQRRQYLDLIPRWMAHLYKNVIYPRLPSGIRSRKLAYNLVLNGRDRFIDGISVLAPRNGDLSVLDSGFLRSTMDSELPGAVAQHYFDNAPASDLVSRMQYVDIKTYLTADVLTKVDRMSMACSLEVRCPLLDHVLVEFAVSLPASMKLRGRQSKYLLRRLAERLGVPHKVLYRSKQGFALPLVHWMRQELKREVTDLLLEPRTLQRGYFQRAGIERLLQEHQSGQRDHSTLLWELLAFEMWQRNYLERLAGKRLLRDTTCGSVNSEGAVQRC
jgi:asparagine synthase (glutamine-hydrolysing)